MAKLQQTITVTQGTALYVGAVLGSGILILPGMTAAIAGQAAIVSWILMVILSIPLAHTFANLSSAFPSSGGIATFAHKAFGYYVGALVGWFFFFAGSIGQIIVSLTGGTYIAFAFQLPPFSSYIIAIVFLFISLAGNYYGIKTSSKVQFVISGLTFLILLGTILLAIPVIHPKNLTFQLSKGSFTTISRSAMMIFWSFFGWEAISSLAPEFKNPRKKNIMRATWYAVGIIGILYLGIAFAVIGTHSYVNGHVTMHQSMNNASLAQVVKKGVGVNGSWLTAIVAFTICLGTTNAFVASMSRLGYSLAHNQLAPKWLDHINDRYEIPGRAVLLVGAIAIGGLMISFIFHISLDRLVIIPNSLAIATYVVGTAAGVKLIKKTSGKWMAMIACILCLGAYPFVGFFITVPLIVGSGCFAYLSWRMKKRPYEDPKSSLK